MPFTAAEIARQLQGEVVGDAQAVLKGFAPAEHARTGDLTFAENEDYFARAEQSAATAIIADHRFSSAKKILIRVPNARIAFAKAMALFFPERTYAAGIHPTAVVAASAKVDADRTHRTALRRGRARENRRAVGPAGRQRCRRRFQARRRGEFVSRTSRFIRARKSARACASTPARWSARTDSVTCRTAACTARCRRSAMSSSATTWKSART